MEVRESTAATATAAAAALEAERRVGVLVCGLFFRLRKGNRPRRGEGGGGGKGRKRRAEDLVELRGAARKAQISRDLDRVCREEGGWSNDWAFSQGMPYVSPNPVPEWAYRPLCPGEWREGTGVSPEGGRVVGSRSVRLRAGAPYGERMRILAEAAGTFDTLLNLGWGRYIGPRPRLPGRPEEGMDDSGVT